MHKLKDIKIAVIGLGYVGLPLAVAFGIRKEVVGFDINLQRVEDLKNGDDKTLEIESYVLAQAKFLKFSTSVNDLLECNCFIVTVPTPVDEHYRPDLSPLEKASETIGKILKLNDIVIYESTVYPGDTEDVCVTIL